MWLSRCRPQPLAPGPVCLEHPGKGLQALYLPLPPDPCLVPSSSVLGGGFGLLGVRQYPAEDGSPILSSDLSQGKGQPDLSEVIGYIEGLLEHGHKNVWVLSSPEITKSENKLPVRALTNK